MKTAPSPELQAMSSQVSYDYWLVDKVQMALRSLKICTFRQRHLIAGPFAGEFGYELMQWQGYVRAISRFYETVHVITYPGRDYLYEGCTVHHHDILLQNAGYGYGHLSPKASFNLAKEKAAELGLRNYDIFVPALLCTQYHKRIFWPQTFRLLEEPPFDGRIRDVAFHFRAINKEGPDQKKNYTAALADELAMLCLEHEMSVICIGHPDYAYCARGCEDMRSVDLQQSVAAIHSARVVAGENSGAMHLANICGKPTILWANDQWRIDYSLRWNPFRVPIYTASNDTHRPHPEVVLKTIRGALEELIIQTDGFRKPCYQVPSQPIAFY